MADSTWELPPGTVYLGNGHSDISGSDCDANGRVFLHPQPSNDPNEPLNWPTYEKVVNFSVACLFTLMVFATLDIGTVTWNAMGAELGFESDFLNASYAAALAGLAVGSVLFAPSALIFGRKPVYLCATLTMVLVNVGQAMFKTKTQYIVLQVLAGLAGSINDTIIQISISDLFFVHQRATLTGVYTTMVVVGTYLSMIPAGYIVTNQGWRWVWWWCAILNAVIFVLFLFAYGETRYRKSECFIGEQPSTPAAVLKEDTGKRIYTATPCSDTQHRIPIPSEQPTLYRKTYIQRMTIFGSFSDFSIHSYWQHMWRPFILFFRIPAVAFTAIEYSFILCWVAVLATTQPILFAQPPYNFSSIGVGNINIAPFIGAMAGSAYGGPLNDYYVVFIARRREGIYHPETRLHMLIIPVLLTPLGLFLYGISIAKAQPWIVLLIGSGLAGFGVGAVPAIALSYFADSYREIIAEGLIIITVVRNGISTATTFAIYPWLNGLGLQNMFISVGCISLGILLLTIPMAIWGRKARCYTAGFYNGITAGNIE